MRDTSRLAVGFQIGCRISVKSVHLNLEMRYAQVKRNSCFDIKLLMTHNFNSNQTIPFFFFLAVYLPFG